MGSQGAIVGTRGGCKEKGEGGLLISRVLKVIRGVGIPLGKEHEPGPGWGY